MNYPSADLQLQLMRWRRDNPMGGSGYTNPAPVCIIDDAESCSPRVLHPQPPGTAEINPLCPAGSQALQLSQGFDAIPAPGVGFPSLAPRWEGSSTPCLAPGTVFQCPRTEPRASTCSLSPSFSLESGFGCAGGFLGSCASS